MDETVWQEARRRARAETLDLARLNDPYRTLLTLGLPIVALAVSWLFTGELAYTVAGALIGLLAFGALIYTVKLVQMPATIAQEERRRRAALESVSTQLTNRQIADELSLLFREGEELVTDLRFDNPPDHKTVRQWLKKTREYLRAQLGEGCVIQFDYTQGITGWPQRRPEAAPNKQAGKDMRIIFQHLQRLREIIERIG